MHTVKKKTNQKKHEYILIKKTRQEDNSTDDQKMRKNLFKKNLKMNKKCRE